MISFAIAAVLMRLDTTLAVTPSSPGRISAASVTHRVDPTPRYVPIHDVWCSGTYFGSDGNWHLTGTFEVSADWDARLKWNNTGGGDGKLPRIFIGATPNPGDSWPIRPWTELTFSMDPIGITGSPRVIAFDAKSANPLQAAGLVAISLEGTHEENPAGVTQKGLYELSFAIVQYPTTGKPSGKKSNNVIPIELIRYDAKKPSAEKPKYVADPTKLHFFSHKEWVPRPSVFGFNGAAADAYDMSKWMVTTSIWESIPDQRLVVDTGEKRHASFTDSAYGFLMVYASDPSRNATFNLDVYECDGVVRYVN